MAPSPTQVGKYRIEAEVGRGGFAVVYRAFDPMLQRRVALKIPYPWLLTDSTQVERFQREARVAASLKHPNIVTIYEIGEDDGQPYIAMEWLEGMPLDQWLNVARPDPQAVLGLLVGVGAALDYAHAHGVIHRDIKPSNLVVEPGHRAVLTDFGIAKAAEASQVTHTGLVLGTPQYMSPEQAIGKQIGPASDIYSLGIVLYQILTGRLPFEADNTPALLHKQVYEPPIPARKRVPGLPAKVDVVLAKALAKDAAKRYTSAEEMVVAVKVAVGNQPIRSVASELPTVVAPVASNPSEHLDLAADESSERKLAEGVAWRRWLRSILPLSRLPGLRPGNNTRNSNTQTDRQGQSNPGAAFAAKLRYSLQYAVQLSKRRLVRVMALVFGAGLLTIYLLSGPWKSNDAARMSTTTSDATSFTAATTKADASEATPITSPRFIISVDETGRPDFENPALQTLAQFLGFSLDLDSYRLDPLSVDRMKSAGIQHIELKGIGKGLRVIVNGSALPYITWTDASLKTLGDLAPLFGSRQDSLTELAQLLSNTGGDVVVRFPLQNGALEIPLAGNDVVLAAAERSKRPAAEVLKFELWYAETGVPTLLGIPAMVLAASGVPLPALDPSVVQVLQANDIQHIELRNELDEIQVYVNGAPLPTIVWDEKTLDNAAALYEQANPGLSQDQRSLLRWLARTLTTADIQVLARFPLAPGAQLIPERPH